MNSTILNIIFTLLSMSVFLGVAFWAYSSRNKERLEAIGRSVLDQDNAPTKD